jgi:hypothetical protein
VVVVREQAIESLFLLIAIKQKETAEKVPPSKLRG